MTTTIEECNVKCPECGRNIFEAVDNGRCVYCGAVVEDRCQVGAPHPDIQCENDAVGICACGKPVCKDHINQCDDYDDIIEGVF